MTMRYATTTVPSIRTLSTSGAEGSVTNTVTETDMWNFTIPANSLVANSMLRIVTHGSMINNSGSSITYRFRWYLGATVVFDLNAITVTSAATVRWPQFFQFNARVLTTTTATTAGIGFGGPGQTPGAGAAPAMNTSNIAVPYSAVGYFTGDWSTSLTCKLTCTMGTASTLADCRFNGYTAELLAA